jgi:LmbE family N-acetylglucosaminyl deacetylase
MTAKRRRAAIVIWSIIGVLLAGCAALSILRPRLEGGVRPADVPGAKRAGDDLLASRETTVLVVVAHPDDTEWWAGGTVAALALHNRVVLIMGTSGDQGAGGNVPGLGPLREDLQRAGGAILGYSDIVFLRHPDGALAQAPEYPAEIEAAFRRYRPTAVITFDIAREGPVYHHPDHEAAGRVTAAVAERLGGVTEYLFHTSAPDVIVDYGPVREKKREAFAILQDYRRANPYFGWLAEPLGKLMAGQASYGSRAVYTEVGVDYGEVFRRVVIPAR